MQSDAWTSGAVNAAAEMAALCSVVEELEQQLSDLEVQEAKSTEAQAKALAEKLATLQQALGTGSSSDIQHNGSICEKKKGDDENVPQCSTSKRSSDGNIKSNISTNTATTAGTNSHSDDVDSATSMRVSELMEMLEAMGMADFLHDERLLRALVLHHPLGQASYDEIVMMMLDENFNRDVWCRKLKPRSSTRTEADTFPGQADGNSIDGNDANGKKESTEVAHTSLDEWVCFCTQANSCVLGKRCTMCDTERNPTFSVRKRLATATEATQALSFENTNLEAASASAAELVRLLTLEDQDPGAVVWEYALNSRPSYHHHELDNFGDHQHWLELSSTSIASLERAWSQELDLAYHGAQAEKAWLQGVITAAPAATSNTTTASAATAATPNAYASAAFVFRDVQFSASMPEATIRVFRESMI